VEGQVTPATSDPLPIPLGAARVDRKPTPAVAIYKRRVSFRSNVSLFPQ